MADTKVPCPKCGRAATTVLPFVKEYTDPHFSCKCGYKGKLHWVRNS